MRASMMQLSAKACWTKACSTKACSSKNWATTGLFLTFLLAVLVTPAAADKLDDVKARGKLVVGVSDTTPPFSFRKLPEDAITGYDIDLVKGVAKRLGLGLEMVPVSS